ncbi:hypothetical protein PsorP6_010412 [Peronosclerospora sorghi]|uniref:Uncharacterized protein n=1 Tax=Peronosclerospora sorghi TaxID=230839 RepID=A0ACC0VW44_9STRA|nr:hypothetical protein PsorP6_010412 [Peronosclerospora sorghi]
MVQVDTVALEELTDLFREGTYTLTPIYFASSGTNSSSGRELEWDRKAFVNIRKASLIALNAMSPVRNSNLSSGMEL